ncbi:MAG TPA: DNA-3-methyladenine glycosylase I [Nitrospira sp.]
MTVSDEKIRCGWVGLKPHLIRYHDEEWAVPVHDDRQHFEMLLLEGAQASLTWETILLRREGYRKPFNFSKKFSETHEEAQRTHLTFAL